MLKKLPCAKNGIYGETISKLSQKMLKFTTEIAQKCLIGGKNAKS